MKKSPKDNQQITIRKRLFYYTTLLLAIMALVISLFTSTNSAGYFFVLMTVISSALLLGVLLNNDITLEGRVKGRKLFLIGIIILWLNVLFHGIMLLIAALLDNFTSDTACTGFFGAQVNCSFDIAIINALVFYYVTPMLLLIAAFLSLAATYGKKFGKLTLR